MAFPHPGGSSGGRQGFHHAQPFVDGQFDIFEWHAQFQSCVRYFLDHAQHTGPVQAVAAFVNIQLPFQRTHNPVLSSRAAGPGSPALPPPPPHHGVGSGSGGGGGGSSSSSSSRAAGKQLASGRPRPQQQQPQAPRSPPGGDGRGALGSSSSSSHCTLTPYIRRLVATGFDYPAVLHGFFGDDWALGVGPLHEAERRNYLFAAKSDTWLRVKTNYDMGEEQMIPFLKPLLNVTEGEIVTAEGGWSEWLAMQDWMLGPRAPGQDQGQEQQHHHHHHHHGGGGVKMEHHHHRGDGRVKMEGSEARMMDRT